MSITTWRYFNFFDATPIKDPSLADEHTLYSDPGLTAITPGLNTIFFATSNAVIKEFSQDLTLKQSWTAYEPTASISYLRYLKGTSLLLSVGETSGIAPVIKLWNLEKRDKKTGFPHLHSTVSVSNGDNISPISSFDITSDHSLLAFGFADGTVILVRGDIVHDRGARQRVVYDSNGPVTGLAFCENKAENMATLFVATVNRIFTVSTTGKNNGKPEKVLDKSRGADLGCTTFDPIKQMFVVARSDSVSYYTTTGRGPSFVFEISKKRVFTYKQYVAMVSFGGTPSSESGVSLSNLLGSVDELFTTSRLLIVDGANQYIAYTGQISGGIKDIFVQWNKLLVLGADGVLYQFEEKSLQARLDILTGRNLYDVAIQLGKSLNIDREIILKIEKEYGDYLYKIDDVVDALPHYIQAIDLGKTSEIILKYRESQYILQLTEYLEALHDKGLAQKEHTTLLLNSYAKLKNHIKLQEFIENDSNSSKFDFETAIQICRQSEYYDMACELAKKMGEPQLVVQIKLKDLQDYKGALSYVHSLPVDECLRILIQNSRVLLNKFPNETTLLLIDLFTGKYVPKLEQDATKTIQSDTKDDDDSAYIAAPVLQSYRAFVNYMSLAASEEEGKDQGSVASDAQADENSTEDPPTYQPPRPRLIFSSFVDHPNEFVIFLEACLEAYEKFSGNEKDRTDILSTLYEMYLELSKDSPDKKEWEDKAKALATESAKSLDPNTILLLSHLANFSEGELFSKDQEGFQTDLFRSCVAMSDVPGAIHVLKKYGDSEPELYPLALTFFTSSPSILEEAGNEFEYVLNKIKDEKLMAPLQVVQALSVNSVATVGLVKQYLIDLIEREKSEIDTNLKLSASYRAETQTKQAEIDHLKRDPQVIQYTSCSACGSALDLPAVHFGCKHSFHQRCLHSADEANPSCPICLPAVEAIAAIRRGQDDTSDRYDLFKMALDESESKFKVVTDFLGRGAMEQARYILR